MPAMRVPIACSLSIAGAQSQLEEWRSLLFAPGVEADRQSPTDLRLTLPGSPDGLGPIIGLAQREKACCPFFGFSLLIEAETVSLHISVPEEATSILDDFTGLAPA